MELTHEIFEQLKTDLTKAKTFGDLMGPVGSIKKLMKNALEECRMRNLRSILISIRTQPQEKTQATAELAK